MDAPLESGIGSEKALHVWNIYQFIAIKLCKAKCLFGDNLKIHGAAFREFP